MPTGINAPGNQLDQYFLETLGGTSSSQFGGATTNLNRGQAILMSSGGNLNVQLSHAGLSTVTTGAETTLASFTLPANTLDVVGRGVQVQIWGSATFASGTAVAKLYFGSVGTSVGTLATTNPFWAELTVFKDGASSQNGSFQSTVSTTHGGTSLLSQTETDTAAIVLKVTANQSAVASAIKIFGFVVTGFN